MSYSRSGKRVKSTLRYDKEQSQEPVVSRSVVDPTQAQKTEEQEKFALFAEIFEEQYLVDVIANWDGMLVEIEAECPPNCDACVGINEIALETAREAAYVEGLIDEADIGLASRWLRRGGGVVDRVVFRALEELGWTIQINLKNDELSVWADRERKRR